VGVVGGNTSPIGMASQQTGTVYRCMVPLHTAMRTTPSVSFTAAGDFALITSTENTITPTSISVVEHRGNGVLLNVGVAAVNGIVGLLRNNATPNLTFSAEL
jgi:hypothetical protein